MATDGEARRRAAELREALHGSTEEDGGDLRHRALEAASRAYSAAHGHPLDHTGRGPAHAGGRARWRLDRTAGRALLGVLALAVLVVVLGSGLPWSQGKAGTGADLDGPFLGTAPADATTGGSVALTGVGGGHGETDPGPVPLGDEADRGPGEPVAGPTSVHVHVVGEVLRPGVVRLEPGARVIDALEAAGGPTSTADLDAVNLARTVTDGEQIHVPLPGELVPQAPAGADAGPVLVDLNQADEAALDGLPGVGPVLAGRILAWRDTHGRFTTVEELGEVSGIGPRVLENLRDLVTVG